MVVPAEISWACNMGEVATVAAWLDSGNDPDEATADGDTLLFAAAERGGPEARRLKLRFDFRTGATAQITPCVTTEVTTPRQ